ncbi:hypothetical protein Golax_022860 [Gossypium laxum]|uniref:Uncharacterized protein n=1 Tax=Gossypium laxum TaxID=34288 RepID=A0A7J9B5L7_9ROSI|nr:hypothetical protein [Gossypium laxum]
MGFGPRRLFWRTIWKLRVLPKICIFARRYEMRDETIIHVLRNYSKARAVLSSGGLDGHLLDSKFESCIDWLEDAIACWILRVLRISLQSYGMFRIVTTILCLVGRRRMLG